jgi:hypothetical protein
MSQEMTQKEMETEILKWLAKSKNGLSGDDIKACMALNEEIILDQAILEMILDGELTAEDIGENENINDVRRFKFVRKDPALCHSLKMS